MARQARWIRCAFADLSAAQAAGAALCALQLRHSTPIALWCRLDPSSVATAGDWANCACIVILPVHLAPGRSERWPAWALAPAASVYREFGLRAYQSGVEIHLRGERIALGRARCHSACAQIVVALRLSGPGPICENRAPEVRAWLRERLGVTVAQADDGALSERAFETLLRVRVEAQHDWQFENSWLCAAEQSAVDAASRARGAFAQ